MITITNSCIISSSYKTVELIYMVPLIVTFIYAAYIVPALYIVSQNPYVVSK